MVAVLRAAASSSTFSPLARNFLKTRSSAGPPAILQKPTLHSSRDSDHGRENGRDRQKVRADRNLAGLDDPNPESRPVL
jgi:hypothetical protein